jgi:hypothetical protein
VIAIPVDQLPRSQKRCGKQNGELSFFSHWNPHSLKLSRAETGARFYFFFQISQIALRLQVHNQGGDCFA